MNQKNIIIIVIIAILVVGTGSFYGGIKYANSKKTQNSFQRNGVSGANGQRAQGMRQGGAGINSASGSGFVNGEIIKKDDKSITIKVGDARRPDGQGGSKIVYISDSAIISKSVVGAKDDLEIGKNVMINGSIGEDGSIVAQFVQIRSDTENH